MSSTLILIRTDFIDPALGEWARTLRADTGFDVVFAADERARPAPVPDGFDKISVTSDSIARLGLAASPDFAWRCGDYCFYLARERFRDAQFFWLIEPDVFLSFDDYSDLFSPFESATDVDLIAPGYRKAEPAWMWTTLMAPIASPVYGCLFPLVRLSSEAVRVAYDARRALTEIYPAVRPFDAVPNDESLVATTLTQAGLTCKNINDFDRRVYAYGTTFVNGRVFSWKRLHAQRRTTSCITRCAQGRASKGRCAATLRAREASGRLRNVSPRSTTSRPKWARRNATRRSNLLTSRAVKHSALRSDGSPGASA